MVVSSNTLFQFTRDFDTILKILESKGFWPKYCIEFGWRDKSKTDFAVPQCCFCDIPLSAINNHMKTYGDYGIGMTKEWGINKGLSPVMYVIPNSHLINILKEISRSSNDKEGKRKYIAFLKCYKAVNYRFKENKWKQYNNYLYYNEREWRYVPSRLSADKIVIKVDKKEDFNPVDLNYETKTYLCDFSAHDIRYMIVKDDEERLRLIEEINKLSNWNKSEKDLLSSKILTHALIEEDI